MNHILLLCGLLIFISGCVTTTDQKIDHALQSVVKKYPHLQKKDRNPMTYYSLKRSVTLGKEDIMLQLRSAPDSEQYSQSIIVILNHKRQAYAIPYFTNAFIRYWNFEYGNPYDKRKFLTFEKELKNCFEQLGFFDSLGTANTVCDELFTSLLQCQRITEKDSSRLVLRLTGDDRREYENAADCEERNRKNWKNIADDFGREIITYYSAYWDHDQSRVYHLVLKTAHFTNLTKSNFTLKTYRFDCNTGTLNL